MGTRSSIFVKATNTKGKSKFYRFYKHWDGYPTGNLSLIHKLAVLYYNKKGSIKKLMALASQLDEQECEFEGEKKSLNEIVSHNEHGDLAWNYLVDLDAKSVKVFRAKGGESKAVLTNKTTNPTDFVEQLVESARKHEQHRTESMVEAIQKLGFTVNG